MARIRPNPDQTTRRLRRVIESLADALQIAVLTAEHLGKTATLTVHEALSLTRRLRQATRILRRLRPTKGGAR